MSSTDGSLRLNDFNQIDIENNESKSSSSILVGAEKNINIQLFLAKYIRIQNRLIVEFLAELTGSFFLIKLGLGCVAQFKFSSPNPDAWSSLSINIGFGIALCLSIIMVGNISGGHLSPAISLAMFLTGRLNFSRLIIYVIGQFIGSFIGAVVVFIVYYDSLKNFKSGMYSIETAAIFATYPNENLSIFGGFLDQVVGTIILVLVVLAVNDPRNEKISNVSSILCGLASTAIGLGYGYNCGAPLNPTRDFAPRLFTLIAGWGTKTFTEGNYFFWIPIVAPMVGSLLATLIYTVLLSAHYNSNQASQLTTCLDTNKKDLVKKTLEERSKESKNLI